jgi:hypothetical protein
MLFFGSSQIAAAAQSATPDSAPASVPAQSGLQDVHDTPVPLPAPQQPLPYSHKAHLALGLQCTECHTNPDHGRLMTFPDTARCMKCHASFGKSRPSIQKLAAYDKAKTTVPWVRVYTVLPGVKWSHRTHLDAGMKCEMCHGNVSQMQVMTNVKSVNTMVGCLDCHTLHSAPTTCTTCHPAWEPEMGVNKKK